MKAMQADQEREKQRRLEVERGRRPSLVIFPPFLIPQLVLMLWELESRGGVVKSSGQQSGRRYPLCLMNLSSPGFSTQLQSRV